MANMTKPIDGWRVEDLGRPIRQDLENAVAKAEQAVTAQQALDSRLSDVESDVSALQSGGSGGGIVALLQTGSDPSLPIIVEATAENPFTPDNGNWKIIDMSGQPGYQSGHKVVLAMCRLRKTSTLAEFSVRFRRTDTANTDDLDYALDFVWAQYQSENFSNFLIAIPLSTDGKFEYIINNALPAQYDFWIRAVCFI